MNKILILLTIVLVILIIGSIILLGFNQPKPTQSPTPGPFVYPTPIFQSPTISPTPMPSPTTTGQLQVVSVEPVEDLSKNYNPVIEIKFTFNDDIDLDSFLLEISPNTQIRVIPDTKTHSYTISPKRFWPTGITTISIQKRTKSLKGYELDNTFTYKINIQLPENPPPDAQL